MSTRVEAWNLAFPKPCPYYPCPCKAWVFILLVYPAHARSWPALAATLCQAHCWWRQGPQRSKGLCSWVFALCLVMVWLLLKQFCSLSEHMAQKARMVKVNCNKSMLLHLSYVDQVTWQLSNIINIEDLTINKYRHACIYFSYLLFTSFSDLLCCSMPWYAMELLVDLLTYDCPFTGQKRTAGCDPISLGEVKYLCCKWGLSESMP